MLLRLSAGLLATAAFFAPLAATAQEGSAVIAASMGHDVRTHMKHYGKWTDDEGLMASVQAITKHNEKLTTGVSCSSLPDQKALAGS